MWWRGGVGWGGGWAAVVWICNSTNRSYLGNQFRDFMKAEKGPLKDHYMDLNSAEQRDYKLKWAAKQFDDFKEAKVFKQSWQRVDTTKGDYLNFAAMVVKLGGWKSSEAVEGAVSCAQKCLAMGRPWIQIHPQTGLANFLLLSFGFSEVMTESWELFRSEYNTRGGPTRAKASTRSTRPWRSRCFLLRRARQHHKLKNTFMIKV